MKQTELTLGIDIGSTTAKVVLVEDGRIIYEKYQRHFSQVRQKTLELLEQAAPYAGGRLFDAQRSPFGTALTPVQCIHYCLTRPAVASVLAGYDTPEHVEQAVAYETAGEAEKDYASVLARAPRHTFGQGECTYCGHCRPCPVHIDIAMVNKYYDLASMQADVPASVRAHYEALEHRADQCTGCKGCESRCPFGVKVAERMVKTAELFRAER